MRGGPAFERLLDACCSELRADQANHPSAFQRFVLPGLAFKAVVIGGGYATGREIAEFFLPAGPWGGIAAMAVATVIWCVVCAATFVFARRLRERDYRSFFRALLGRAWPVFEIAYVTLRGPDTRGVWGSRRRDRMRPRSVHLRSSARCA